MGRSWIKMQVLLKCSRSFSLKPQSTEPWMIQQSCPTMWQQGVFVIVAFKYYIIKLLAMEHHGNEGMLFRYFESIIFFSATSKSQKNILAAESQRSWNVHWPGKGDWGKAKTLCLASENPSLLQCRAIWLQYYIC